MYRPDLFRVDDVPQMHALMRARPFAALISNGAAGLYASHLPTVLKEVGTYGAIEFHLARANPHWKELAEGNEALMIFQGPEGYITPKWILPRPSTGKSFRLGTSLLFTLTDVPKRLMNQNREAQDRLGVVKRLGERCADDLEMADFVSRSVAAKD
jgi:predicted FMN-binding regulatory protein PaiB